MTDPVIMTVRGPIPADELGFCLPHEHVMVDFIGARATSPTRWNGDDVVGALSSYLLEARRAGVSSFVDCTPAWLGRDPAILRRLSGATGLQIVTNTGHYKEPYLPAHALRLDSCELADLWLGEWTDGIEGTEVRPGFVKIAVSGGGLAPLERKGVRAAAMVSRASGLLIACHSGCGLATLEALEIIEAEGVAPDRLVFVHADAERDLARLDQCARRGVWIEFDSVGWRPVAEHTTLVRRHLDTHGPERLLLSHDAGWYHVGEPEGGAIRPFTPLALELLPALRAAGIAAAVLDRITAGNPAEAFAIQRT